MPDIIRILCVNLAGGNRRTNVGGLVNGFSSIIRGCSPHVLLCQEAAREVHAGNRWAGASLRDLDPTAVRPDPRDLLGQLAKQLQSYRFFFAPAIQSNRDAHPKKWGVAGMSVPVGKIRGQGCAMAVHEDLLMGLDYWTAQPSAVVEPIELTLPLKTYEYQKQQNFAPQDLKSTPIYEGNRDSEPRIVQGLRVSCDGQDWVIWNIHLTTITKERADPLIPVVEDAAKAIRSLQLDLLAEVHRQHREFLDKDSEQKSACWVIGGDFNATPAEIESHGIKAMFQIAYDGPTRPKINQVQADTVLYEAACIPGVRPVRAVVLVSDSYVKKLQLLQGTFDTTWGPEIDHLVDKQRVDHFPLLVELERIKPPCPPITPPNP